MKPIELVCSRHQTSNPAAAAASASAAAAALPAAEQSLAPLPHYHCVWVSCCIVPHNSRHACQQRCTLQPKQGSLRPAASCNKGALQQAHLEKLLQAVWVAGGPRIKVQALVLPALIACHLHTRQ